MLCDSVEVPLSLFAMSAEVSENAILGMSFFKEKVVDKKAVCSTPTLHAGQEQTS